MLEATVKRLVIALLAVTGLSVGLSEIASAADLPVKALPAAAPVYSWTGFYFGGTAGYGWGGNVDPQATGKDLGIFGAGPQVVAASLAGLTPLNTNPKGFLGGIEAGYNYQISSFVWGIETDFSWGNITGSGTRSSSTAVPLNADFLTTNITASEKLKTFGTFRGRLGITPFDRGLLYATGGLAYGQASSNVAVSQNENLFNTFTPSSGSGSSYLVGWTLGGGAEWAFGSNWSAKAEYLYYNLGHLNYSANTISAISLGVPFTTVSPMPSAQFSGSVVRLGLNYKFGH
jgi:outer membrane immunogenic protein